MQTQHKQAKRERFGRPRSRRETLKVAIPPRDSTADEHQTWRASVDRAVRAARTTERSALMAMFPGLVAITILAALPDEPRELGELTRPLVDAFTAFGVIENPAKVVRVVAEWSSSVERGTIEVEVRQFSSPETRQRMSQLRIREAECRREAARAVRT